MFELIMYIMLICIPILCIYGLALVAVDIIAWVRRLIATINLRKKKGDTIYRGDDKLRLDAFMMVDAERDRQDEKWGQQNHHPLEWNSLIGEEKGEFEKAINQTYIGGPGEKGGYDNMMEELSHVAATAIAAMESLMRNGIAATPSCKNVCVPCGNEFATVCGHDFEEVDAHDSCTVQVLRCVKCGVESVGWHKKQQ